MMMDDEWEAICWTHSVPAPHFYILIIVLLKKVQEHKASVTEVQQKCMWDWRLIKRSAKYNVAETREEIWQVE